MKSIYVLRSVSGAGKSTFAESLKGENTVICCADDFFYENGVYRFDASKLGRAHAECQKRFIEAIEGQTERIIVANTNTTEREFKFYQQKGEEAGYMVFFIVVENRHGNKNSHDVPENVLDKQKERILNSLKL